MEPLIGGTIAILLAITAAIAIAFICRLKGVDQSGVGAINTGNLNSYFILLIAFIAAYISTLPIGIFVGLVYLWFGHGGIPEIKGEVSTLLWLSALWFPLWWSPAIGVKLVWYLNRNNVLNRAIKNI